MARTSSKPSRRYHGIQNGYRSGLEESTAEDLKRRGVSAKYEEVKIKFTKPSKPSTYTPDFVIDRPARECPECLGKGQLEDMIDGGKLYNIWECPRCKGSGTIDGSIIIETKGRFVTADRQKHLLIKEQHPNLDIRFLFQNSKARISKSSKTTYADWCRKHGFQFADKVVPEEWLK